MQNKTNLFWGLFAVALLSTTGLPAGVMPPVREFAGKTPLQWSVRMADSQIARLGNKLVWKDGGSAKWDYTAGLFTLSLLKLNEKVPDPRYVKFAENAIGSFISPDGKIQTYNRNEYQLDALNPGKTALVLWELKLDHDGRYFNAVRNLASQLESQPRTPDGGFWHKQRYTNQMWLDGIYMASPFYAAHANFLMDPNYAYNEVAKQIRLIDQHTYDSKTGLNYHGWDAAKIQSWANPETGCSSNFWGRAIGWYGMALVDTLDFFPTNHPARAGILATLQKLCAGVVKHQDPSSGLWWQVVDQGNRSGNYLEATASAMFVYTLAKGVNKNYLPRAYVPAVLKGYQGIVEKLIKVDTNGQVNLTQCCQVAGLGSYGHARDGSFNYYVSEPIVENDLKGVGPFILAGIELQGLPGTGNELPAK